MLTFDQKSLTHKTILERIFVGKLRKPLSCELLPVIECPDLPLRIEDFNPKSMKIKEIVGKLYNF
jgi:hypothetical protein